MEIELKPNGAIVAPEEVLQLIEEQRRLEVALEQNKQRVAEFKEALLKAMESNGVQKWENDAIRVTYIAPTTRKSVDTEALKRDGLYDAYTRDTDVKASVRIKYKESYDDLPY